MSEKDKAGTAAAENVTRLEVGQSKVHPVTELQKSADADILVFNGPITSASYFDLVDYTKQSKKRKNVFFFLATYGGDADAAYRIARCLKARYEKVTVCVSGMCKSAGTLVAVGADDLVIAEGGELGPLDIQLRKHDEIWEYGSGLDVTKALEHLEKTVLECFRQQMLDITVNAQLSVKLASEISSQLTVGLYGKLYEQVDPVRIGEVVRATNVATDYGKRLGNNLKPAALKRLVHEYPSHSFVIDLEEAKTLFRNVREPTEVEQAVSEVVSANRSPRTPDAINTWIEQLDERTEGADDRS